MTNIHFNSAFLKMKTAFHPHPPTKPIWHHQLIHDKKVRIFHNFKKENPKSLVSWWIMQKCWKTDMTRSWGAPYYDVRPTAPNRVNFRQLFLHHHPIAHFISTYNEYLENLTISPVFNCEYRFVHRKTWETWRLPGKI